MVTIELHSYGSAEPLVIRLPSDCTCETASKEVAKILQLKEESLNAFALFCGKLECPVKVLRPSDSIPSGTKLSLQRWCMQPDEGKTVRRDDVALHLLYCQAKAKLERGDMKPSAEQLQELESFSDPFFPTERQYLEVARSVPGYSTMVARDCVVAEGIDDNDVKFGIGERVKLALDLEGLSVISEASDSQKLHWPWTVVRRWKRMASKHSVLIKFEVCLQKLNAGILSWITFETPQVVFLFQTAGALCAEVKRCQDAKKALSEPVSPSQAGRFHDPLREWVDNTLFASRAKFSSLK